MKDILPNNVRTIIAETDPRTRLLRKNILANVLLKACTGVITLLLVPLTLKCLGVYSNGVWLTISAALLWIENLDIGLGNGLRNKISEYVAKDDWTRAQVAVSSTLVMLVCLVLPVMILLVLLTQITDVYSIFNVSEDIIPEFRNTVSISIVLFSSTFIMKFIGNVYMGMQLPAISNLLVTGGHPIILCGTLLFLCLGVHSIMAIAILNLAVPLIMYIVAYPYTFYCKYPGLRPNVMLFSLPMAKELLVLSVFFFLNQIASSIVFLSSNILISRWFSPSEVTPYQIAYRYFCILILIFTVINMPNWNATTDAYHHGDIEWIRKTSRRMEKLLLGFFIISLLMIALSTIVYSLWIGDEVHIPLLLTVSMALYIFLMMVSLTYCYFLNGIGALKLQLLCTVIGVVAYFLSAYILKELTNNVTSVSFAVCIALLPNAIVNRIQFNKIVNKKATGIWMK